MIPFVCYDCFKIISHIYFEYMIDVHVNKLSHGDLLKKYSHLKICCRNMIMSSYETTDMIDYLEQLKNKKK